MAEPPPMVLTIDMEPTVRTWNTWAVTINAKDVDSGEAIAAWVLIDDDFQGSTTPMVVYLAPSSTYNLKLRAKGYKQTEQEVITEALPV